MLNVTIYSSTMDPMGFTIEWPRFVASPCDHFSNPKRATLAAAAGKLLRHTPPAAAMMLKQPQTTLLYAAKIPIMSMN